MPEAQPGPNLESVTLQNTSETNAPRRPAYIVGIGASAGGLEALERFFERMPLETGMAFVVVQHLSPDFRSLTDELLARRTAIPIHQVENSMEVLPDAIYLIPPKKDMIIANGRLLLTDKDPGQLMRLPIDHFFRSLAQEAGDRSIGIVLSGTGSDGSRGIRDIHEAGGLVMVQSAESAKFDGMPKSALKTGVVDMTLPPDEMPAALLKYIKHPLALREQQPAETVPVSESSMDVVFRLLRDAYDIDFAHYKPATVARRTERRVLLAGAANLDEYVRRLASDAGELSALYKDLLIGVTRFFRDKEAFESLATNVLPELLEQVPRDDEFRAWVAGCATGEEAYSLAILVREQLDRLPKPIHIKIFATDVHRESLEVAGQGIYSEACLGDMSAERRERFFLRKEDNFQVAPELRKMVVFAQHNVIKDAPFTKLDLISCRNLLIYLQPLAQKKALSLFHFGLKAGGSLFLGPSESTGELEDEFDTLDARWKIYRKRRDVRLPTDIRLGAVSTTRLPAAGTPGLPPLAGTTDSRLLGTYDAILNEFMPPSLLINEARELVQTFAGGSRYLRFRDGRFTSDVLDLVEPELRLALSGALQRAYKEKKPVVYKAVHLHLPDSDPVVDVTVRPVSDRRSGALHALICLEEVQTVRDQGEPAQELDLSAAPREHLQALEMELRYTKENLQATIEELETSNEELQATNEELVASNEELQSANEELHSVNEELYTVNGEYQKKIAELTELTADMENLLTSAEVHTIFLDRKLCIRKFTPKIAETFHLLPQDIGRRIDSFTHTIDYPNLVTDLRSVLETAVRIEKQVRDHNGRWFLLRLLPYRAGTIVEGVVLTLIDIDSYKQAEAQGRRKDHQLTSILRNSHNPIFILDCSGRFILANEAYQRLVGCDPVGKTVHDLFPAAVADLLSSYNQRALSEGVSVQNEVVLPLPDGPHTYLSVRFPLRDSDGTVIGIGGIKTDVTALKQAETKALEAVQQRERFLAMLSHELRNPLAAILNAAHVLNLLPTNVSETATWIQLIERRAEHMARLLDDLLEVSRLTQNKIEIRKQAFNLATTVADAVEEVRPRFTERGVQLTVHPPDAPLLVEGDPARLQQIQVNLLTNAAKYTPTGGRVWYTMQREADRAVIRVRDTGMGIAPDQLERVFDLFFQGADGPNHGGLGVGLTLVKSIVELHGGQVKAYSEGRGKGSEFIVSLPLAPPEACPLTTTAEPVLQHPGHPLHILIVEDDADIRQSLQTVLEFDGHRVRTAVDGPSALEAVAAECPDVALVDLGLPHLDGYEVARQIRQRFGPGRPCLIALTGYGQAADRRRAADAGFNAHLTKPLKVSELTQWLQAVRPLDNTPPPAASSS